MAVGQMFTSTLHERIDNYVKTFLTATPSLYNFFKTNGLVRNIPLAQDKLKYFEEKEPRGGQMASSIHDAVVITPQFDQTTVGLLYLVGKIQISLQDKLKASSNQFAGMDIIQRTIQSATRVMLNQVDQFLAWGDEMKNPVDAIDPIRGLGEFTGIFNGGTEMTSAGIDNDENMTAAGDYLYTISQMKKALLNANHPVSASVPAMLLSDLDTEFYSEIGNNFYNTVGITEQQRILEKKWIKDWMTSPNFVDYTEAKTRMAMIVPRQRTGKGPNDIRPNFELVQSFPFYVHPEHKGGTNNGYYEYLLIWSGRLLEYHPTSIQRTGDLTLS